MNEDSKQKLSRPLDPSPRGSNRPAEKGNLPPSPRHPALYLPGRETGACREAWLLTPGPAPALEQRVALTIMEKMRGMRLRGQMGQKQEVMARTR